MRILGIDPGLRATGWGIIESEGNHLRYISHGIAKTEDDALLAVRLYQLHQELSRIIDLYKPDVAAVEEVFVNKNPLSTLKLGMARGVVLLAPAERDLFVAEYSANKVKKSVVGSGHASKEQVEAMIKVLLPEARNATKDAADALAVAICHAHFSAIDRKWI
ncbi:MAG: crossover junction endodeoxyribonuclease RuvC [Alphaproteobacteria bacterium]|nr:crossover junction endodeoxyribonuclease RuvC [Alphaproteobacteria bacterium]